MQLPTTNKTDIEMIDDNSDVDEIQINTELQVTTSDDATISSSSFSGDDLYDYIEKRLLSLDPNMTMALGSLTYHSDFHPHFFPPEKDGGFGKMLYKRSLTDGKDEADVLGLVFIGEICPSTYGTAISAEGNHYVT